MVTIPEFAEIGSTTRQQLKAETLGLLPIVRKEQREEWELYTQANDDWVEDGLAFEELYENEQASAYDLISRARTSLENLAELDPEQKHAMSHRADAFNKLVAACF